MARILLDMDGVLCNLIDKWFSTYNREYNDAIEIGMLQQWGPHHYARAGKAVYKYLSQPGFFRDLDPIPGAVEGVHKLLAQGHDVVVVTAAKNGHRDKLDWIREHIPEIKSDHVIFSHRKELVRGDVLFDDAPHNLEAFAAYAQPVAMAYPYNQGVSCPRMNSWGDFNTYIETHFSQSATPAFNVRNH